eukprot:CAMPEP_0179007302 /NCGR_PEP_ID=MMETSP0795-20121207/15088_1 /TAXON_ID=88552 /ORGANISM="Amoebophrya sp., Strain Ameob2" /LENGTH=63 /DNA_ID=CAMNT_0020702267 /DNA_START=535 /DNA_END=726 /DNA_ORIENTATION=-
MAVWRNDMIDRFMKLSGKQSCRNLGHGPAHRSLRSVAWGLYGATGCSCVCVGVAGSNKMNNAT